LTEFASAAALASVVGLITLLGLSAFLSLNTAQAVPIACPAASRPSLATWAACSPYLSQPKRQYREKPCQSLNKKGMISCKRLILRNELTYVKRVQWSQMTKWT